MHYGRRIVHQFDNEFGDFTIEEQIYEGRQARVLYSGPEHAAQSGIALDNDPQLLFDYNQRLLEVAEQLVPKNVLILGGGTLTLATALNSRLPKTNITVVERNPVLTEKAIEYFGFKPNRKIKIIYADAAEQIKRDKQIYDFIAVDLYDDFTIPPKFLTESFAGDLFNRLNKKGVIAANCIAATLGNYADPLKKLSQALESKLAAVRIVKANNLIWTTLPANLIIIASADQALIEKLLPDADEVTVQQ